MRGRGRAGLVAGLVSGLLLTGCGRDGVSSDNDDQYPTLPPPTAPHTPALVGDPCEQLDAADLTALVGEDLGAGSLDQRLPGCRWTDGSREVLLISTHPADVGGMLSDGARRTGSAPLDTPEKKVAAARLIDAFRAGALEDEAACFLIWPVLGLTPDETGVATAAYSQDNGLSGGYGATLCHGEHYLVLVARSPDAAEREDEIIQTLYSVVDRVAAG